MLCKSNFQPEPIDNCEQIHIVTRLRTRKAKEEVLKWLKTEDPTRGAQHQPEGVVAEARRDSEVPFSNGHLSLLFQDPTPTHGKGVPRIYI